MDHAQSFFAGGEFQELSDVDLHSLVASRLEDLADRVEHHCALGDIDTARFLRDEGLELASAYDFGVPFFYVDDLTTN